MAKKQAEEAMGALLSALRRTSPDALTQDGLASSLSCSASKIALVESGARPIRHEDIEAWADALEVPVHALKRLSRGFQGYLTAPDGRELWWREPWSNDELRPFEFDGQTFESEEEREHFSERLGDDWYEHLRVRYRTAMADIVTLLFAGRPVQIELVETSKPLGWSDTVRLTWHGSRGAASVLVDLDPPYEAPVRRAEYLHRDHPGSSRALDELQAVMTPQEVALVTAYALGLVAGRANSTGPGSSH